MRGLGLLGAIVMPTALVPGPASHAALAAPDGRSGDALAHLAAGRDGERLILVGTTPGPHGPAYQAYRRSAYQPDGAYSRTTLTGTHEACLDGPDGAGHYRYRIQARTGGGDYTLGYDSP